VNRAIAARHISESEASDWLDELRERARSGSFAAAVTAYTVVGRKTL
jgi:hypothetical protein